MRPIFTYAGTESFAVPKRFWEDHIDRGCRCADRPACPDRNRHQAETEWRTKDGRYLVNLTAGDANELASDADYYASQGVAVFGREALGLVHSARATLARLTMYASTFNPPIPAIPGMPT